MVREVNRKKRVDWCKERKTLAIDEYWRTVIFVDESHIVFGVNNRVYMWPKDDEKHNPLLLCVRPERKISLIIWGCVCYDGVHTQGSFTIPFLID